MNKKLRTISFVLAACLILTTVCPVLPAPGKATVVEAASKKSKISVSQKGTAIFIQIGKNKKASGFFKIPVRLKSADGRIFINKGIYYLYKGKISVYKKSYAFKRLKKVNKKGRIVSSKKLMLQVLDYEPVIDKGVTRIISLTKPFTGTYKGVRYKKGKAVKAGKKSSKKAAAKTEKADSIQVSGEAQTPGAGHQVVDLVYYFNGVPQYQYTGWLAIGSSLYFINKGIALSNGYHLVPGYKCRTRKFSYKFDQDGTVVKNLFGVSREDYRQMIKMPMRFEINLATNTFTIYMKNPRTRTYDIPMKSFICCSSRHYNGTPTGNYTLNKGRRHRWFIYRRSNPYHYYQYSVKIGTTDVIIHSNMYYSTNNRRLVKKYYNQFGKNITTHCVRVQVVNAKMIYDIARKNRHKIKVKIYRNKANPGPYGKIRLSDTTGKTNKNYDPTDPNIVRDSFKRY